MPLSSRLALALLLVLVAAFGAPAAVLGDGVPQGRIVVPGDHFQPGETITVAGSELTHGSVVVIRLSSGPTIVELGRATVADDATLSTTATIPESFPLGYAELTARDQNGNTWSTLILIGDRAEGPKIADTAAAPDERVLWLVVLGIGLVIFVLAAARAFGVRRATILDHD